jgi:hypothetical protein
MRFLSFLLGFALIMLGVYFLGRNIIFTTNVYPYWWRGIAADASILSLSLGIISWFALPSDLKFFSWILVIIGILLVFLSSRAILNPTSLWQFFISFASMIGGYQLLTTGRIRI